MNWTGFLTIWAAAFVLAGVFLAIENDQWGIGLRNVWAHRSLLIAGMVIGSIAVLTATH